MNDTILELEEKIRKLQLVAGTDTTPQDERIIFCLASKTFEQMLANFKTTLALLGLP